MLVAVQDQGPTHSLVCHFLPKGEGHAHTNRTRDLTYQRSDVLMRQSLRRVENMTRKLEQKIDTLVAAPPAQVTVARPPMRGPPRPYPAPMQSISAHPSPQHPAVSELPASISSAPSESSISASAPHAAGPVVPIIEYVIHDLCTVL